MNIKKKNIKVYEEYYKHDEVKNAYEVRDKIQIIFSIKMLFVHLGGKKVLDIGFGTGDILLKFYEKGADCFGLEISSEAIKSLKKKSNSSIQLFKGDLVSLPFKSDFFDVVICSHVLEHVEDDKKAISEIKRVLKKNGLAVIGVPSVGNKHNFMHYREYSISKFKTLIGDWNILSFRPYGSKLFQLIIKGKNYLTYSLIKEANDCEPELFREKCSNDRILSVIKKIYYILGVPTLLFLQRIDNILPFLKEEPIEIWTVLEK